ncbi:hypothetical protein VOLCADRAFT_91787 [Volvox carteri f. nagariensis]|uniref:Uncharacterized protein n=1 Tax=Volvox carteri f. nagariensis TaxID=3068 RepID=D8TXY5_VOLCA|nr:uncharacterized protein VOLCADRAFT_91787 [Volvox carteri f. nagariensis]EFJ47724.1 hypothetical protein VOLCADRAFT_91787 [Volvox carteri f. nagariensis]|eukprot:XP_002951195.1 hypothetical protein VOLCADRAFT_91787 [Volvox carteri f. nagariensis]
MAAMGGGAVAMAAGDGAPEEGEEGARSEMLVGVGKEGVVLGAGEGRVGAATAGDGTGDVAMAACAEMMMLMKVRIQVQIVQRMSKAVAIAEGVVVGEMVAGGWVFSLAADCESELVMSSYG